MRLKLINLLLLLLVVAILMSSCLCSRSIAFESELDSESVEDIVTIENRRLLYEEIDENGLLEMLVNHFYVMILLIAIVGILFFCILIKQLLNLISIIIVKKKSKEKKDSSDNDDSITSLLTGFKKRISSITRIKLMIVLILVIFLVIQIIIYNASLATIKNHTNDQGVFVINDVYGGGVVEVSPYLAMSSVDNVEYLSIIGISLVVLFDIITILISSADFNYSYKKSLICSGIIVILIVVIALLKPPVVEIEEHSNKYSDVSLLRTHIRKMKLQRELYLMQLNGLYA